MIEKLFIFSIVYLSIIIVLCTIRAIKGPTPSDRLIAINVIGTKTMVLIAIISFILKEQFFLDVTLVYALISFVASIIISQHIEKNRRTE